VTHTIAHRIGRHPERAGLLERDRGQIYLAPEAMDASDEDPSNHLLVACNDQGQKIEARV